jgi:peptide/nickel transport system permease protein
MGRYITRRILINIPVLLGITFMIFAFIEAAPGDPLAFWVNPEMGTDEAQMELLRERFGLNEPFGIRYLRWLGQALTGNLGFRYKNFESVSASIATRIGPTLLLIGSAMIIGICIGIPMGVLSALKQYSFTDFTLTAFAFLGISLPAFFAGLGGLYLFAIKLDLVPVGGMYTIGQERTVLDTLHHLALPAAILSLSYVAILTRYTRSSMLEVMRQDYITTARAKGLKERLVIVRHAFRNALIPILTVIGLSLPNLIAGAVFIETIFAWPGLGRLYIDGAMSRDYPMVLGMALITALMVLVANLLTDITYAMVDPRIRYD